MNEFELLTANAWLLMDHRNIIFGNEDWRNIHVEINNGVTFGALPRATVGAYLKFWLGEGCVECWHTSKAVSQGVTIGSVGLVCKILGNAGTGTNSCTVAWSDGAVTSECLSNFGEVRREYVKACRMYPTNPDRSTPTLQELIEALKTKH